MKTKAKVKEVRQSGSDYEVVFSFKNLEIANQFAHLMKEPEIVLNAEKEAKRRSLQANAYLWTLLSKIAQVEKSSADDIYYLMLQRYSIPSLIDGEEAITVTLRSDIDPEKTIGGHWKFFKSGENTSGAVFKSWYKIKGSSEMDSKEMNFFLERVIEEAQSLLIDTCTPLEKARMINDMAEAEKRGKSYE